MVKTGSPEPRSFLTPQRGNAVHDALRRKRTRSVQTGMPTLEPGHDGVIPADYRSSRSSVGMQFTTHRVARGRRASRPACPRWSLGTMVLSLPTIVPHAPAWECSSRRSASQEDAERPDRHTHAEHGYDSVIPADDRSSRSSVGMQFTTLCVARGRGASRPACPRWSMGTMVLPLPTIVPHAPAWAR
jgi:hypothetical protein